MTPQRGVPLSDRFALIRKDRGTPEHDAIMKWLHSNVEVIVERLFPDKSWLPTEVAELTAKARSLIDVALTQAEERVAEAVLARDKVKDAYRTPELHDRLLRIRESSLDEAQKALARLRAWPGPGIAPSTKSRILRKDWEYWIENQRGYEVGRIDMHVEIEVPAELKLSTNGTDPLDSHDLPLLYCSTRKEQLFFEVKPMIPSLGELIGQVNLYRRHTGGRYYVVSPDDSHTEILKSQRIGMIPCPPVAGSSNQGRLL